MGFIPIPDWLLRAIGVTVITLVLYGLARWYVRMPSFTLDIEPDPAFPEEFDIDGRRGVEWNYRLTIRFNGGEFQELIYYFNEHVEDIGPMEVGGIEPFRFRDNKGVARFEVLSWRPAFLRHYFFIAWVFNGGEVELKEIWRESPLRIPALQRRALRKYHRLMHEINSD